MPLLARALRRGCTGIPKITMMTHGAQRIDLPTGISQPVAAGMLEDVTRRLRDSNASALWLAVPESSGAHAAAAAAVGFVWHHAESGEAMMVKWLGAGKSPIPPYATHKVRRANPSDLCFVFKQCHLMLFRNTVPHLACRDSHERRRSVGGGWRAGAELEGRASGYPGDQVRRRTVKGVWPGL